MTALLDVRALSVHFRTTTGLVRAVEELSFHIAERDTVAIVGESGSGKSTAALALLRLIPDPPGRIVAGQVMFEGRDLTKLPDAEIRRVRGRAISMIFQDPMMALNPVYTIGRQIEEVLKLHLDMSRADATSRAIELLRLVGVPAPEERVRQYPHTLSGGMRQRAMIAMALACKPRLLIADEPTTALDVTVQAQVLELIQSLKEQLGMSVLLITHDLGVVAETAQRVIVMYGGRKVEEGPVEQIFRNPRHPYTKALLAVSRWDATEGEVLPELAGDAAQRSFAVERGTG
jgi:peptide/nickel transport system ATP-binding protein